MTKAKSRPLSSLGAGLNLTDIPEAIRESTAPPSSSSSVGGSSLWMSAGALLLAAVLLVGWTMRPKVSETTIAPTATPTAPETTGDRAINTDNVLGHLPYQEAPAAELVPITSDGAWKLRRGAAAKFQEMRAAARRDGVELVVISAFRSLKDQEHLFFGVKEQRDQDARTRAEVSAPPGYSEHHTGYAVDLGDAGVPSANLQREFETTRAFQWLATNAARYSFELSFPKDNPQGINYEPWHWRFVGDRPSLETFYRAHQLPKP